MAEVTQRDIDKIRAEIYDLRDRFGLMLSRRGGHVEGQIDLDGWLQLHEGSAPGQPATDRGRLYAKADGVIYWQDDTGTEHDLTSGGAGGGAPEGADYLVLTLHADLTSERRFVAGTGLDAVDGGANGDYTLSVDATELDHADLGGVLADQHHNRQHVITDAADHTVTGSQWDLVGLTGTDTLGILTPSDNPGGAAKILKTDASGYLGIQAFKSNVMPAMTQNYDLGSVSAIWFHVWGRYLHVAHDATNEVEFICDEFGDLKIDPYGGTIYLDADLIPYATDSYDLGSSTRLWRKGWLSEMEAVLFAENTITLLGGWFYVPKYAGTAQEDVDDTETQIDLGASDAIMAQNDFIVFRRSLAVEYMQLGSYVGSNVWNVTRNVDGSGANTWPQGAPYACLGYDGAGRIEFNAYDTPRISVVRQGTSYNTQDELIRLGDLNGLADYSSESYGIFIGDYAGDDWLAYDPSKGLRMHGNGLIDGTVKATKFSIGFSPFRQADGIFLLGQPLHIEEVGGEHYVYSSSGIRSTLSGAVHLEQGRWIGSRGIKIEPGTTNYFTNPVYGHATWDNGWSRTGSNPPTAVADTQYVRFGSTAAKVTFAGSNSIFTQDLIASKATLDGNTLAISAWVKTTSTDVHLTLQANYSTGGGTSATHPGDGQWHRLTWTLTPDFDVGGTTTYIACGVHSSTNGAVAYVDGFQLEVKTYATTLAVGNMGEGYLWNGTPHASTSGRTTTGLTLDSDVLKILTGQSGAISMWIKFPYASGSAFSTYGRIFEYGVYSYPVTTDWFAANFDDDGDQLSVSMYRASDASQKGVGPVSVSYAAGEHVHVLINWTPSRLDLWWNGENLGGVDNPNLFADYDYAVFHIAAADAAGANPSFLTVSEIATFADDLTDEEIALIYNLQAPMTADAFDPTPGVYILDGKFRISSSSSGTRIEITPDQIAGYNGTTKQFYLQASDGKAYAGGGNVILDEDGIAIAAPTSYLDTRSYKFTSSGNVIARVGASRDPTTGDYINVQMRNFPESGLDGGAWVISESPANTETQAVLWATHDDEAYDPEARILLRVDSTNYGEINFDVDGLNYGQIIDGAIYLVPAYSATAGDDLRLQSDWEITYATSRRDTKANIVDFLADRDRFMQLKPSKYHEAKNPVGPKMIGLIAEDVDAVFPDMVTRRYKRASGGDPRHEGRRPRHTGELQISGWDDRQMLVTAISIIQQQEADIQELQNRIAALEGA